MLEASAQFLKRLSNSRTKKEDGNLKSIDSRSELFQRVEVLQPTGLAEKSNAMESNRRSIAVGFRRAT